MLNHTGTKTLETERLILRQFKMEDAGEMFTNWASEDAVTRASYGMHCLSRAKRLRHPLCVPHHVRRERRKNLCMRLAQICGKGAES